MKAIIMAGGRGTRLMPLTKNLPKPMVSIMDKPVLEHLILHLKKYGITDVTLTLGYLADRIISHFGTGENLGVNISYSIENQPLGTAGGVKKACNNVSGDFFVLSGDAYTEIDLNAMSSFHKNKNSLFTISVKNHKNPSEFGVVEIDYDNKITAFLEKPPISTPKLINTGIYLLNERILSLIPDGFYDFGKDLLPRLVGIAHAYVDYSYWSDIGTLSSYYETNEFLLNNRV